MDTIQLKSAIGRDGVLEVRIPFDPKEAGQEVTVTVVPSNGNARRVSDAEEQEWHQILKQTYGAGVGLGLERQHQGVLEEREAIE